MNNIQFDFNYSDINDQWNDSIEKLKQKEEYVKNFKECLKKEQPEKMNEIELLTKKRSENREKYHKKQNELTEKINNLYKDILHIDKLIGTIIDISDEFDIKYLKVENFTNEYNGISLYGTFISIPKNTTNKDENFEFIFKNNYEQYISFEDISNIKFVTIDQFKQIMDTSFGNFIDHFYKQDASK